MRVYSPSCGELAKNFHAHALAQAHESRPDNGIANMEGSRSISRSSQTYQKGNLGIHLAGGNRRSALRETKVILLSPNLEIERSSWTKYSQGIAAAQKFEG